MVRRRLVSAIVSLVVGAGCAATQLPPVEGGFAEAVRIYRMSGEKKALALATDENGRSAYGALYESVTQGTANEKALEACASNALRSGVKNRCYLFAVGDAPAAETVATCAAGRIPEARCTMQSRYALPPQP